LICRRSHCDDTPNDSNCDEANYISYSTFSRTRLQRSFHHCCRIDRRTDSHPDLTSSYADSIRDSADPSRPDESAANGDDGVTVVNTCPTDTHSNSHIHPDPANRNSNPHRYSDLTNRDTNQNGNPAERDQSACNGDIRFVKLRYAQCKF